MVRCASEQVVLPVMACDGCICRFSQRPGSHLPESVFFSDPNVINIFFLSLCVYVHICTCGHRGQKRLALVDFLGLELQVVMSHLVWVLGTKLHSLCKSRKSSSPLSRLSSPDSDLLK